MTRFLIALLALLGLAAQAPACARVSDARHAVGVVAAERAGMPATAAHVSGLALAVPAKPAAPVLAAQVHHAYAAPVAPSPALPGIDRSHE